jgi:signal transduction histidine kinase
MRRTLFRRTQRLIIWLGLLPLLLALAAYRYSSQHVESVDLTLTSAEFIRHLDDLFSTVKDAERGQRGYLLTGNPRYAKPFVDARKEIEAQFAEVAKYAAMARVDPKALARLRELISNKMAELGATTRIRSTEGLPAAMAIVKTDRGEAEMMQIRTLIGQLREQQLSTFHTRLTQQRRSQVRLDITLAIGVFVSSLLLLLAYRVNSMYAEERDRIEADILLSNDQLEARVKERTTELEHRTQELQKSNADLLQFAYVASHDLQEPLRMVASYVGLLAKRYRGKLDASADTYIGFAVEGASRMQTLINDLLIYSRAGTQAVKRMPVASEDILHQALANLSLAIGESSAQVEAHDLPVIEADPVKFTQVIQNLVANSIKFRRPGVTPEISIRATKVGSEWLFSVSDNGIGFDPRYTEKIFQIFQRLHGVGQYSGTGIGLALCKRIVEHHGGRLWADSELGKGSTFFFTLPILSEIEKNLIPQASSGLQSVSDTDTDNGDPRSTVRNSAG